MAAPALLLVALLAGAPAHAQAAKPAAEATKATKPAAHAEKKKATKPAAHAHVHAVATTPHAHAHAVATPPHAHAATTAAAESTYEPLLSGHHFGWRLQVPVLLVGRAETASSFAVDRSGDKLDPGTAVSPLLRVDARLDTLRPLGSHFMIHAEYEQDLPTGTWLSVSPIAGPGMPGSEPITTQIRKAFAQVAYGRSFAFGGGLMTSQWGLGLVANDGAQRWEPGSADFTDPRGGDLVLRGFAATGPMGGDHIVAALAFDKVEHDDVLLAGDTAYEGIASVMGGHEDGNHAGLFVVYRQQRSKDGRALDVVVLDPAGRLDLDVHGGTLKLEGEAALVFGSTSLGASPDVPVATVLQLGGVLRATYTHGKMGGVLDLVYASGDSNIHDGAVTGFHADPNFETGLLLFRYVQAAQSGRGVVTASDPQLAGVAPTGIERLPTRGGLTDAAVIFPRFFTRPTRGLELYGGLLVALAPSSNVDPFNTDVAGGSPKNALGGDPGSYWGTEVDLGVRYQLHVHHTVFSAGAECGVLMPGSALQDAAGTDLPPIYGGRILLGYRL